MELREQRARADAEVAVAKVGHVDVPVGAWMAPPTTAPVSIVSNGTADVPPATAVGDAGDDPPPPRYTPMPVRPVLRLMQAGRPRRRIPVATAAAWPALAAL
jgi:hypothetical protein